MMDKTERARRLERVIECVERARPDSFNMATIVKSMERDERKVAALLCEGGCGSVACLGGFAWATALNDPGYVASGPGWSSGEVLTEAQEYLGLTDEETNDMFFMMGTTCTSRQATQQAALVMLRKFEVEGVVDWTWAIEMVDELNEEDRE